ncbi:MAG: hypothetical protein N3I35_00545 [Clostridia bacterium]|nr:hypothetical protein [Clostridia bacterium]
MSNKIKSIKLTETDKRTISMNSGICTDSHGKACTEPKKIERNERLN